MNSPTIPASDDALGQIRRLARRLDRGVLSTLSVRPGAEAWPYGSLVLIATDADGSPLMLLSDLADHTRNLKADPRASLLLDGTAGLEDPLTGARATVIGRVERTDQGRDRFLARHPSAERYAGFGDFNLYRMRVERAHMVAGFGRIHWIDADPALPAPQALTEHEADIVSHMNEDHGDAIDLYAAVLLGRSGSGWRMTGIDAEGCDLRLAGETARLEFPEPVTDPEAARAALVRLVKQARGAAA
jgi:putative heme iron utilization protein